jgi:hypothetical protein
MGLDITTTSGAFEPYNPHTSFCDGSRDERVVPLTMVYITLRKRRDTARALLELKYQLFFMPVSVLILMNGS